MLENLSDKVRLCYERAVEAKERADEMPDPEARADFLRMEQRWLLLARSYQFGESLDDFARSASQHSATSAEDLSAHSLLRSGERSIRHHEADVASILANTPVLLTRCSSDLRYLFVSEACARMLGRWPEEFEGKPIVEMLGEEAFHTILPYVQRVLQGETVEYEDTVNYKGSGPRHVIARYTPDRDKAGNIQGWVASIVDVTDKRNAETRVAAVAAGESLLQEISKLLVREGDVEALYERVLDGAIALMSADMGSMQIFNRERGDLELIASRGFHPESASFWKWVRLDSASTCAQALSSGQRVVVSDVETCAFMAATSDLASYRRSGIRAVQSTPLVSRSGRFLGMISTHWRTPHQPSEQDLRPLDVLARQAADLIEGSQAEAARLDNEEKLRLLASVVEGSDDAVVTKNLDGIITSWNPGAERIFGYAMDEVIGKPVTILIPPDRHDEERGILERIRRGERIDHYETVRQRKDGSKLDISLTVSPLKDAAGKIVGASKIARDITDRKQAQAQIAVLAREAEHRAKNVLATVQAAVHLSQSDTPDGLKRSIAGRIQALANVHRLFVETRWTGADLRTVTLDELSPYCQRGDTRTQVEGTNVTVKPDVAQAMAVILHELATNAAKYGALSVAGGRLHVGWSHGADERLVLRWTETGGPPVKPPMRQGFGTRVMKSMICDSLKGDMSLDWREDGLVCEIAIPV